MPQLMIHPRFQVITDAGIPAVGWKIYTYAEGTSTPKATYTDIGLGASNTNPIILDARGEAVIYLSGAYKIVLKDDLDVTKWTQDGVRDLTLGQTFTDSTLAGTLTVSSTAITWSGNPTHSGNHTFSGNVTVQGNTQLGNAVGDITRIDSSAVTWTNNPTHSGNHTFSGNATVQGTLTGSGPTQLANLSTSGNTTLGDALGDTLSVAADALKVHSDGRISGNKLHNIGTVTGTTDQFIASGTYTPTLTNATNITASTANLCRWMRVGNVVHVGGSVYIDPTTASLLTQLRISLPIASNLDGLNLNGTAVREPSAALSGYVKGEPALDVALLTFVCDATVSNELWDFTFTYEVV